MFLHIFLLFVCLFPYLFIYKGDEEKDYWVKSKEQQEKSRQKKGNSKSLGIPLQKLLFRACSIKMTYFKSEAVNCVRLKERREKMPKVVFQVGYTL